MSYMVFVEGKQPPTREHQFLVEAKEEAVRLASQPDNNMKKVYVMQVIAVNEPVVMRVWKD